MDKQILKEIAAEQREFLNKTEKGVLRDGLAEIKKKINFPSALVIAGIRRSGKSTLLCQIMDFLKKDGYYFNFEDERLVNFDVADFNKLYEVFIELYGERKIFFFDEIQNIKGWERFIRRMHDRGYKFFITGSNASLLSRELGTRLTGRYTSFNLYPFSFQEYLRLNGHEFKKQDLYLTQKRGELKKYFNAYLKQGGMPEYLKYGDAEALKKVYNDILYRDIASRYGIEEIKSFRELSLYLASNISSLFTYNSLKKFLNLGSVNTVKSYIDYLENSFLFFSVNLFSYSLKKQIAAPKKIYCVDNGIANSVSFKFSEDKGRFLENLVFLELKRRKQEIYYYKTKNDLEIDFLMKEGIKPKELLQVAWNLADPKTKDRELKALFEAMEELNLKKAVILTDNEDGVLKEGKKEVVIKPVYRWLLEN